MGAASRSVGVARPARPAWRVWPVCLSIAVAVAVGCASGKLGDNWTWKRRCGTTEQLEADRQACTGQTVGVVDPSGRGSEYGPDMFRECMESRGWQRVAPGTVIECR